MELRVFPGAHWQAALQWGVVILAAVQAPPHGRGDPNDPAAATAAHPASARGEAASLTIPGLPAATARERAGLGLLSVIDQYQVDLSRLALGRDVDATTQAFAETLLRAQSESHASHDPWLPDLGQALAREMMRGGQGELARLAATPGADFPAAWLQAVRHSLFDAIALLDRQLIPTARTPDVRAHLLRQRERLARQAAATDRLATQAGPLHRSTP